MHASRNIYWLRFPVWAFNGMIARSAIKSLVRRCTRSDIGRIVITGAIQYLKITFLKNGLVASYVENQVGARPAAYIPLITSVDLMCILELPGRCYPLPIEFISLRCSCESLLSLYNNLLLINLPQSEFWFIQQQKSVTFLLVCWAANWPSNWPIEN